MSEKSYQLRTLSRALDVLAMIETSTEPLSMTAIADRLEESGPVIFRILKTLEAKGYIRRHGESKRYVPAEAHDRLGTARLLVQVVHTLSDGVPQSAKALAGVVRRDEASVELVLGVLKEAGMGVRSRQGEWSLSPHLPEWSRSQSTSELLKSARPVMEKLAEASGETVALFVRNGSFQVALDVVTSPHPLRYAVELGAVFPVTRGAAGKAALAWLSEEDIRQAAEDKTLSDEAIDLPSLFSDFKEARMRGFALSFGERITGAAAVAVPVLAADGSIGAAIALTGPASRCPEPRLMEFGKLLRLELARNGLKVPDIGTVASQPSPAGASL